MAEVPERPAFDRVGLLTGALPALLWEPVSGTLPCHPQANALHALRPSGRATRRKVLDPDGAGANPVENTIFVYDGPQIVLQFDNTGTGDAAGSDLSHRYLWGPAVDQVLADEQVSSLSTPGVRYWPLSDHLGSVRDVVDDSATVQLHRIYDAFGNIVESAPANITHLFAFTARPLDEDSGLQNNLNRWYDLSTGRWMSEDPIGFEARDSNLYRYVRNSSTIYGDPRGRELISIDDLNDPTWPADCCRCATPTLPPNPTGTFPSSATRAFPPNPNPWANPVFHNGPDSPLALLTHLLFGYMLPFKTRLAQMENGGGNIPPVLIRSQAFDYSTTFQSVCLNSQFKWNF